MIKRKPTHPGEILSQDVLPALQINASRAASILQISRQYMSDILNGRKPLTPFLCLGVGKMAGNGPEFWMNMQGQYNLWEAAQNAENRKTLARILSLKQIETSMIQG